MAEPVAAAFARRLKRRRGASLFLAGLPLAFLALAFFLPLGNVLLWGLREEGRWTLARLGPLLADPYVRHLFAFTALQALLSTLLSLALGFPLGWFLTRYRFPGKGLLRAFTLAPFVLPPITVALGFFLFFGHAGYLNAALRRVFGLAEPPLRVLYSLWGIVLAHAFYNAPVFARFVHAAWSSLDPALEEAGAVLGVSRPRAFLTVTLPLLLPALFSAAALVFVLCFLSFAIPLSLGGARYATVEVGIYQYARVHLDFPRAAALGLLQILVTLALAYFYVRAGGFWGGRQARSRPLPTQPFPSRPAHLLWILWLLGSAVLFLGPMAAVVADAFSRPWAGRPPGLAWYRAIFSPEQNPFIGTSPLGSLQVSLEVAGLSTLLALLLGVGVSAALRVLPSRALEVLLMAPMAVSSVVLGLALLLAFRQPPLSRLPEKYALVLAHALLFYPFVVRIVRPIWEGLTPAWVEAARTLGAGRFRAFLTVEAPLLSQALLVAGAFSLALSLGEMTAAAMLSQGELVTLPLAIYRFLSARRFGAASAMASLLIGITVAAVALWEWLGERTLRAYGQA
ncbi:MAG: iron ABC transporter permease [Candidatus Bipolaricaulota bacterium]|nr:iron ABC transporter permease [Candidatus Bipolaricaulota bacterium]MDW8151795.1 iron ABC transporter permease [Candidatus Bipolaricaulota bacterium]